ncbi:hypothetical protein EVAR_73824_1 [Eumeta japonica]|uniref:Uncharacterized protein n=1 Tax=Eumeta variegata TaxID=151549 RepID=A0A4C1TDL6_EUMVA|nr:hypothetical protein EVAR_73824_1 [Eumeta japonica]
MLNNSFQQRTGSIKHNGHTGITINASNQHSHPHPHHQQQGSNASTASTSQNQSHWRTAAMNGFSPASINSSARSRGPFVTQVTLGGSGSTHANSIAAAVQQQQHQKHHQQQQQSQPTPQTVQNIKHNLSIRVPLPDRNAQLQRCDYGPTFFVNV